MVSGKNILEIPTLGLDNLVNKVIKILSGEKLELTLIVCEKLTRGINS